MLSSRKPLMSADSDTLEPESRPSVAHWSGVDIAPGEQCNLLLAVSESYSGMTVEIPIQVRRGKIEGPTVFVSGALHGDELNGTGAIRQLIRDDEFTLKRGSLILIPVLNLLAFERHSRYLPDRRDLNRCFPGSKSGSLAGRMAKTLFDEIVARSDYGIDLHTASVRRTNYPTVRGDFKNEEVKRIALAFGSEIVLNKKAPKGSLRKEASEAGCPTIVYEGGEVWKVEPAIVETALAGIANVLRALDMLSGEATCPENQLSISKTQWVRAEKGGFIEFHIKPGQIVSRDQPLATITDLLGEDPIAHVSPFNGVVLGMTTLPAISPGEPVCHIGRLPKGKKPAQVRKCRADNEGLEERVLENLASNILVSDPDDVV